jgi:hypothetical protein
MWNDKSMKMSRDGLTIDVVWIYADLLGTFTAREYTSQTSVLSHVAW